MCVYHTSTLVEATGQLSVLAFHRGFQESSSSGQARVASAFALLLIFKVEIIAVAS